MGIKTAVALVSYERWITRNLPRTYHRVRHRTRHRNFRRVHRRIRYWFGRRVRRRIRRHIRRRNLCRALYIWITLNDLQINLRNLSYGHICLTSIVTRTNTNIEWISSLNNDQLSEIMENLSPPWPFHEKSFMSIQKCLRYLSQHPMMCLKFLFFILFSNFICYVKTV